MGSLKYQEACQVGASARRQQRAPASAASPLRDSQVESCPAVRNTHYKGTQNEAAAAAMIAPIAEHQSPAIGVT